jgi:hypothetical protein
MKKIFLFLSLVALSLTSCTSDDDTKEAVASGKPTEFASVDANIGTTTNTTSKNVNRGNIFAWVKDINVTATSTVWNYATSEAFTLVASGGESSFTIKDVAVGANKFDAITSSFDANKVYSVNSVTGSGASFTLAQSAVSTAIARNPYAVYSGTTNANIANSAVNTVNLSLNTNNGRIIAAFVLADDTVLRANTYAIVTANVTGVTPNPATLTSAQIKNNAVIFEWSNENSLVGKTITFTVNVYDDTAPNKVLKTYTIAKTVEASTSYSCIYTIDRDNIINNKEDKFVFTFQVWKEVSCFDVFDDGGYNCLGEDKDGKDKNGNKAYDDCGWHKAPNVFYNPLQDKNWLDGADKCH